MQLRHDQFRSNAGSNSQRLAAFATGLIALAFASPAHAQCSTAVASGTDSTVEFGGARRAIVFPIEFDPSEVDACPPPERRVVSVIPQVAEEKKDLTPPPRQRRVQLPPTPEETPEETPPPASPAPVLQAPIEPEPPQDPPPPVPQVVVPPPAPPAQIVAIPALPPASIPAPVIPVPAVQVPAVQVPFVRHTNDHEHFDPLLNGDIRHNHPGIAGHRHARQYRWIPVIRVPVVQFPVFGTPPYWRNLAAYSGVPAHPHYPPPYRGR